MCQTTAGATTQTEEGTHSAPRGTPSDSENGETTRQSVYQDIVQILSAPFDSVPKIHLWI
jgi:hypothetical protein